MVDGLTPVEVDVDTVERWLKERVDFVLVDCREEDEYAAARIERAVLMPMSQWNEKAAELAKFEGMHVVVHCHHGGRSLRVANWLRQNGFPTAQSMAGGIDAWSEQIDNQVPRY